MFSFTDYFFKRLAVTFLPGALNFLCSANIFTKKKSLHYVLPLMRCYLNNMMTTIFIVSGCIGVH